MDVTNMQKDLRAIMISGGEVKQDLDFCFLGLIKKTRGWYIVTPISCVWYLHHDGLVKFGVNADSDKPAFWNSEEDANTFFDKWKVENRYKYNNKL
jgi:hypothetical protein